MVIQILEKVLLNLDDFLLTNQFFPEKCFYHKVTLKGLTTLWYFFKKTLIGLATLWGFYQRFEVLLCVVNFSTSQTWKRFLWGRRLLKRNAYIFKNASANGRTYAGLTTLWGFYRRFEISTTSRRLFINHIHPNLLH